MYTIYTMGIIVSIVTIGSIFKIITIVAIAYMVTTVGIITNRLLNSSLVQSSLISTRVH
jgi:hypothetical protein